MGHRIYVVSSDWGGSKGGINTFNKELVEPCRRRYAESPAATPGTEAACANSRTVASPPLCSVLRYAHLLKARAR